MFKIKIRYTLTLMEHWQEIPVKTTAVELFVVENVALTNG